MTINEYTALRAEALYRLNIPDVEQPIHVKTLWLDNIDSEDCKNTIYNGTHSHSFFEMHLVFEGETVYECGEQSVSLSGNQALLLWPHTPHRFIKTGRRFLKTALAFSLDKIDLELLQFPDVPFKCFPVSDEIIAHVNAMLKQGEMKDFFSPVLISGKILEILYAVFKTLGVQLPENRETDTDSRFLVAKAYIQNNKHRLITCEDVAKECCLSVKQISRIFKNTVDQTLFDYIVDVRVKYAKKLLLQSESSVKEIGYMLGFENESSFVSFFKRQCGTPPGAFRKGHTAENVRKE